MSLELVSQNKCFGGWHKQYRHRSNTLNCDMRFAIFLPEVAQSRSVPVLYWLSGLTCTDENFMQKAGAQRLANELGLAIVAPDTSPRGDDVPDDENGAYDFGLGAGFYVNATQAPFAQHYHMYDYICDELPALVKAHFPITDKAAISGHSMGGHGALILGLKNPAQFSSISAFSPICEPSQCAWGQKAFQGYLGDDKSAWRAYDACALIEDMPDTSKVLPIKVDQGLLDNFYPEQLRTERLQASLEARNIPADISLHAGFDHSYYFIASFIDSHLRFHASHLGL